MQMQLQSKYNLDELARLFGKAILRPEINKYKPLLNTGKNRGCGNTRGNRIGAMMFQVEHSYIKNVDVVNTYKAIISIYHNKAKINEITTLKETIKDNRVTSRKITAQLKKIYDNNTEEDNKNQQMLIDKLEKENELLIKKIEAQEADWNEKTKNIEVMQAYRALKILSKGGEGATKLCKKISKVIDGCDPSDTDKHMSGSGSDGFVNIHTSAPQNTSLDNHLNGHLSSSSANTRNPRQYTEDRPRRQNYQDYRDIVVTRGPSEKILAELREKHSKGEYIHASLMKFITEPDTNTVSNMTNMTNLTNDTGTDIALTDMKPLNNIITKTEVIGKWKTKPDFDLISKIKEIKENKETKQIKEPIANTRYYAKPQANDVKNDVKNKLKMPNSSGSSKSIAELDVPRTVIYEDENGNQVEYFEDEMQENMFGEYDNFDEYDIEYNDEFNDNYDNYDNYDNGDDKINASNIAGSDKSRDDSEEAYSDANIYNEFEDNLDYEKYDNEPIDLDDFKV